ncbi:hypothetical protein OV079_31295 [Nannocystis pusilla]|uniref:Uncharacterized protein n=1 Tax=Nannocystis pusilla TaxID=889268 RepID=A0A9X3J0E4_9BACT|nr:hypothetical protein [Nannocystis pusilla]MCY1009970.1 hypothetical protein [Nannocystis pusilla]
MRATFPHGWVWVGGEGDDGADAWTCGAYEAGEVRTATLTGRAGTPAPERRCVLQHAWQTRTSASYTCLGASLLPDRARLRIEVVDGRHLGPTLTGEILAGALTGAAASNVPGVLRFDRARAPRRPRPGPLPPSGPGDRGALASDLAALSEASLGERTAGLWRAGDAPGRGS